MTIFYFPVLTAADLKSMDETEMYDGYRAGFLGKPLPEGSSRTFWHGWNNGRNDITGTSTPHQARLIKSLRDAGLIPGHKETAP